MVRTRKTTIGFNDSLTLYSLFGFLVIMLLGWFSIDLGAWSISMLLIFTGISFLLEGQIMTARYWLKDGVQGNEIPLLLTLFVGLIVAIMGILKMPIIHYTSPTLNVFISWIALFAFVFIVWQRWFYD